MGLEILDKWKADIPSLGKGLALVLLILNIIFPAWGTFLSACLGKEFKSTQIIVGLLQFFTCFLIIGWIWSIWWGILIYEKAS